MAAETLEFTKAFHEMAYDMAKIDIYSKNVAKNFDQLINQIRRDRPFSMTQFIAGGPKLQDLGKLGRMLTEVSKALMARVEGERGIDAQIKERKDSLRAWMDSTRNWAALQIDTEQKQIKYLELQKAAKERIAKFTGETLSFEYLLMSGWKDSVIRSGELNKSLVEANSAYEVRQKLGEDIWKTMAATGASQGEINEAAKALVPVWKGFNLDFSDTLTTLIQMKTGLGVSYENSVQLARVFEINLATPVRNVADQIVAIRNATSLSADEATRFATEIGKALRLLGPGAVQGAADKVAGYVTMMAARMKDVGGDAEDVVKLFSEMTKGTAQGFMLRGLAGVRTPGALGTESGSMAAMQGVDRMIQTIVRSAPGTAAYTAQLEMAAQVFGTSATTVELWRKMIEKSNVPLTENQKLQVAWQEQMKVSNASWQQIKDAIIALTMRAFNPFLQVINATLSVVAKFVTWISQSKAALVVASSLTGLAILATARSLYLLTNQLRATAVAATAAGQAQGKGSLLNLVGLGGLGRLLPLLIPLIPSALLVGAVGATTYGIGHMINKIWPSNWISRLAHESAEAWYSKANASAARVGHIGGGGVQFWDMMRQVRRMMAGGQLSDVKQYILDTIPHLRGMVDHATFVKFMGKIPEILAQTKERINLSSVTSADPETMRRDREMNVYLRDICRVLSETKALWEKTAVGQDEKLQHDKYIEDNRQMREQIFQQMPISPIFRKPSLGGHPAYLGH